MAYKTNPFLERMSERTTSDQEFVRLFSPKILERLPEDAFEGAVHIFRSPPGGGKTTLLRAFTPAALKAFWNTRKSPEMNESYQRLQARDVMRDNEGPQVLGVLLSCASGYADLPPGASIQNEGLFRALLDCRIVLRSLRNLASLLGVSSPEQLAQTRLEYTGPALDLKSIPLAETANELISWAEQRERSVYAQLDTLDDPATSETPTHVRFEGVLWLQGVQFLHKEKVVAPKRILMVDDFHKLRKKQRSLLLEELIELRPTIPVWLAERSIALGPELLSQGARTGRDLHEINLEELWSSGRGHHQFTTFAQNILERRLATQTVIPKGSFSQYLRAELQYEEVEKIVKSGTDKALKRIKQYRAKEQYNNWIELAQTHSENPTVESLTELYTILILIARNEGKRQLSLNLLPLSSDEMEDRDSSQVKGAAEIFMHEDLGLPYYFSIEKFCNMATNNIEELLGLAAVMYEGLQAKQVLRHSEVILSPQEQEKLAKEAAKRKRDFIPKSHTEGTRAQRLLDAIGMYCRKKTFQINAPYAPGVTGIRLSYPELEKLNSTVEPLATRLKHLRDVLSECVAENLVFTKPSVASTSRESGTVFYLNRTLCVHYDLPLQMGGWQDVRVSELMDWMQNGLRPERKSLWEEG